MRKCAQLELFRERLPRKPYYSDELTTGLRIADVARALGARYIQPNGPTHRHWIVFDVDHAAATLSWDDVGAPLKYPKDTLIYHNIPCSHRRRQPQHRSAP
ncbi:replication initiation protein [Klebsiella pneumoniae]|uniref:replication initiation protein n=1 Tax=Klebsiella pneumoniae TaxID=573 RepID=UPI003F808138